MKSLMSRCDFVGGVDLEEEGEMVLDLTADFLMGGQSLESLCRNGGQSSPSASSKTLLQDSPTKSTTPMISSNSHSNVSETSPPSVTSVE